MTVQGDITLSIIGTFTIGIAFYSITRYCRKKYMSAEVAPKFDSL